MTVRTVPIKAPRPWLPLVMLATFGALTLVLVGVILYAAQPSTASAVSPPVQIVATPTLGPAAQTGGLARAIIAYDAPDGNAIGGIEPGRTYTVVARSGIGWLQLDVDGSGLVWTPADQVDGVDMSALADLEPPTPAPAPAPVVAEQPAPVVISQPAAAQEPPRPTPIIIVATAILPDAPRAGQPMTQEEQRATSVAAGDQPSSGLPEPGDPGFADSFQDPDDAATDASFEEPAKPNPFIGCVTQACRDQFGQN